MRKLLYLFLTIGFLWSCEKDEIEFLDAELQKETQARQDADAALQSQLTEAVAVLTQAIADEARHRANGDIVLANNLSLAVTRLSAAIAEEKAAREAGDTALADELKATAERLAELLDAEQAARIAGDLANANALAEAVAQLSTAIQAANNARIAGDAQLQSNLNSAVSALNAAIDAEASARAAGDAALTTEIANVRTELASAVLDLQAADAAEALARAQGDDANAAAIAQAEADLTAAIDAARAAAVQGDADTLSTAQRRLRNTRNALQAQIDTNTAAIAALQTAVDSLNNRVPALETAVSVLTSGTSLDLSNLTTRISELEALVNANAVTADSEIDRVLDELNDAIAELNTAIEDGDFDIENYVSDLEDDLRDAIEKIAALENSQVTLQQVLDLIAQLDLEHDAANNQLQATLDTLSSTLANLSIPSEFDDSALTAAIADLQAQIDAIDTSGSGNVDLTAINNAIQALQDRVNNLYDNVCDWNGIDVQPLVQQAYDAEATSQTRYTIEETSTECNITRNVEVLVHVALTKESTLNQDLNNDGDMEDEVYVYTATGASPLFRVVDTTPAPAPTFDTDMIGFFNTLEVDDSFDYNGNTYYYKGPAFGGYGLWSAATNTADLEVAYITSGPSGILVTDNSITASQNATTGGTLTSAEAAVEVEDLLFGSQLLEKYLTNVRIAGTPTGSYAHAAAFDWAAHQDELSNITVTSDLTEFRRLGTVVDFNAPNDVEQITFTFTSTDYEGSVTVTLGNPAYQPDINDVFEIVSQGSAAHYVAFGTINGYDFGTPGTGYWHQKQDKVSFAVSDGGSFLGFNTRGSEEVGFEFDNPTVQEITVTMTHVDLRGEFVFTVTNTNYDANWKPDISGILRLEINSDNFRVQGVSNDYSPHGAWFNWMSDAVITISDGASIRGLGVGYSAYGSYIDFDNNGVEMATITVTHPDAAGELVGTITNTNYKPLLSSVLAFSQSGIYQSSGLNLLNFNILSTYRSDLVLTVSPDNSAGEASSSYDYFRAIGALVLDVGPQHEEITITATHPDFTGEVTVTYDNPDYDANWAPDVTFDRLNNGADTSSFNTGNYGVFTFHATTIPTSYKQHEYRAADGTVLLIRYNQTTNEYRWASLARANGLTQTFDAGDAYLRALLQTLGN